MKKLYITTSLLMILSSLVMGNDEPKKYYEGSSGKKYQYDMNNGDDQRAYTFDFDAKKRDRMYLDAGGNRARDKSKGQNGGGVYDD